MINNGQKVEGPVTMENEAVIRLGNVEFQFKMI